MRILLATLGVVAAGLLSACTGVPSESSPQTIEQVNEGAPATDQAIQPAKDESARDIVTDFLQANASDPGAHTSAPAFLTTAARSRWSDATVTILRERVVSTYDASKGTVTVSGRLYGTLNREGVFQPGDATQTSYEFRLARVAGQYRIAQISPAPGLLLTSDEFSQSYNKHLLYFFDNENRYLVADPRWTDIDVTDRSRLAGWLIDRLATGPRTSLQNAVSSDTFPTQADPSAMSVDIESTTRVEIPGASQLDPDGLRRLAAQLAATLDDETSGGGMVITDGGRPVHVPSIVGSTFSSADFAEFAGPQPPPPQVYYLSGSDLVGESGKPVPGPLGRGAYALRSVAVGRPDPTGPLLVAAVASTGRLMVGTLSGGLKPVALAGVTTRPSFATDRREVWVGAGTKLYRVSLTASGAPAAVAAVAMTQPPGGSLTALRVSPDGARLALVFSSGTAGGRLYVSAIVRGSGPVRLAPLDQVNAPGSVVLDVGWVSPLRLLALGRPDGSSDYFTYDVAVDGTDWQGHLVGLSSPPDSITVTSGSIAWLSAGEFVWQQNGEEWQPPTGGQTPGTAPVYLE